MIFNTKDITTTLLLNSLFLISIPSGNRTGTRPCGLNSFLWPMHDEYWDQTGLKGIESGSYYWISNWRKWTAACKKQHRYHHHLNVTRQGVRQGYDTKQLLLGASHRFVDEKARRLENARENETNKVNYLSYWTEKKHESWKHQRLHSMTSLLINQSQSE